MRAIDDWGKKMQYLKLRVKNYVVIIIGVEQDNSINKTLG